MIAPPKFNGLGFDPWRCQFLDAVIGLAERVTAPGPIKEQGALSWRRPGRMRRASHRNGRISDHFSSALPVNWPLLGLCCVISIFVLQEGQLMASARCETASCPLLRKHDRPVPQGM